MQKQTLARAIRADGDEAKITTCVQTLEAGHRQLLGR